MVIVEAVMVPIAVMVPPMIVFELAAVSVPIPGKELRSIVTRPNPASAFIRRPRPVSLMPTIVASYRIPITVDPGVARPGADGHDTNHARWRRWTDSDSNPDLSALHGCTS